MEAAGRRDWALQLASDSRWRPGAGYELAYSSHGEHAVNAGGVTWLSFYEPREGERASVEYYDISPIAERLEQVGFDILRPGGRGRTSVGKSLTGLFAPKLGHQPSGVLTAFGVEVSPSVADSLGAFTCLRSARLSLVAIPGCLITVRHRPTWWVGTRGDRSTFDRIRALDEPY